MVCPAEQRVRQLSGWLALCLIGCIAPAALAQTSELWGEHGERWTPQSRLPDFSHAGYQRGEKAMPNLPPGISVKEFGARGTFWNIRAERPLNYPPDRFGPSSMNLVGLETRDPSEINPDGKWFEGIPPGQLQPQNLHEAQRQRRLGAGSTR